MLLPNLSVSVVIPNYNGHKLLVKHLPEVIKAVGDREIIIVDDASTDTSVAWVREHYPQIKIFQSKTNQRFAVTCNLGVDKAKGDIVVLLNNDVSPSPSFLPALLQPFSDPQVFAVGCAEVSSHKPTAVKSGRACGRFHQGLIDHYRCPDQDLPHTLWVSGGSGAFRRSMWQSLKGMDPLFKPAYEEDRDLCYRALKRGWQLVFAPKSLVYHEHESTNQQALGKSLMVRTSYKNQFIFIWKNITQNSLFLHHLLWLPYNLLVNGIRSKGQLIIGFVWAMTYLPQIIPLRKIEILEAVIQDDQIFSINQ